MCWNKEVSLNTFLFSSFVLLLIIYNNKYTQYKIKELNNIWVYLFFVSFILMQLIEYFIWKNIDRPFYNKMFTIAAFILLFLQPIASNMLIKDRLIQRPLLFLYLFLFIPFIIYRLRTKNMNSSVSKLGHLYWNMLFDTNRIDNLLLLLWFVFFLFPLFYQRSLYGFMFGFITLLIIIYNYYKDGTIGSMWCWIVNSIMIFYAAYLLLYLPFSKK